MSVLPTGYWIKTPLAWEIKKNKKKVILGGSNKGYCTLSSPEVKSHKRENNETFGEFKNMREEETRVLFPG